MKYKNNRKNTNRNYSNECEEILQQLKETKQKPKLLLHACCAPCSSYCLEYLRQYFDVTVFYYNPNISFLEEYRHRVEELKRLVSTLNEEAKGSEMLNQIALLEGTYEPEKFFEATKGLEDCPEGGERCFICYELRLREAARLAAEGGYDFFTTTLTISPLKNAAKLNEIGAALGAAVGVPFLPSDFKKKDGYKRSIALSREYGLYRQDYCGCIFSKKAREEQKARAADAAQDGGAR